ncbi:MAG: hypothetical protein AAGE94_11995, partial [Acidobacteriota bacterium]
MPRDHTWRYFLSADWAKDARKRSVYLADRAASSLRRCDHAAWSLGALLDHAEALSAAGPVLVGIDVALGVPRGTWDLVQAHDAWRQPTSFVDWLGRIEPDADFFDPVRRADAWRVDRPFFRVPAGRGGLTGFRRAMPGGLHRRNDAAAGGKPLFAISGIPGTVGSGTRAVWQELSAELRAGRRVAVWPFDGRFDDLLPGSRVVLAEAYPGLAYATALADRFPTPRLLVGKTKAPQRDAFCDALLDAPWVREHAVDLGDVASCRLDEDDFDAHVNATAVLRCLLTGQELCHAEHVDPVAEGGMLLAGP